jgi:hypothetical protein
MIKLRDSSIMIVGQDGRSIPFEPEDLQTRIIKACLSSGSKDVWIAQDISLSVEFAIVSQAKDGDGSIRSAELDNLVARILEETGYPEVAGKFRLSSPKDDGLVGCGDVGGLSELLSKRLLLSGDALDEVLKATSSVLGSLGSGRCSPQLVLELGRHFKETLKHDAIQLKSPESVLLRQPRPDAFLVESAKLAESLPKWLKTCVAPRPLSRLFPALAIDVRLSCFAEALGLERPITEMALLAKLDALAKAIDGLCSEADRLCGEQGRGDCLPLPLWINMTDFPSFEREWLDCDSSSGAALEISSALFSSLSRAPFKTTFS